MDIKVEDLVSRGVSKLDAIGFLHTLHKLGLAGVRNLPKNGTRKGHPGKVYELGSELSGVVSAAFATMQIRQAVEAPVNTETVDSTETADTSETLGETEEYKRTVCFPQVPETTEETTTEVPPQQMSL